MLYYHNYQATDELNSFEIMFEFMNEALIQVAIIYFTHVKPIGGLRLLTMLGGTAVIQTSILKTAHHMMLGFYCHEEKFYYL